MSVIDRLREKAQNEQACIELSELLREERRYNKELQAELATAKRLLREAVSCCFNADTPHHEFSIDKTTVDEINKFLSDGSGPGEEKA